MGQFRRSRVPTDKCLLMGLSCRTQQCPLLIVLATSSIPPLRFLRLFLRQVWRRSQNVRPVLQAACAPDHPSSTALSATTVRLARPLHKRVPAEHTTTSHVPQASALASHVPLASCVRARASPRLHCFHVRLHTIVPLASRHRHVRKGRRPTRLLWVLSTSVLPVLLDSTVPITLLLLQLLDVLLATFVRRGHLSLGRVGRDTCVPFLHQHQLHALPTTTVHQALCRTRFFVRQVTSVRQQRTRHS